VAKPGLSKADIGVLELILDELISKDPGLGSALSQANLTNPKTMHWLRNILGRVKRGQYGQYEKMGGANLVMADLWAERNRVAQLLRNNPEPSPLDVLLGREVEKMDQELMRRRRLLGAAHKKIAAKVGHQLPEEVDPKKWGPGWRDRNAKFVKARRAANPDYRPPWWKSHKGLGRGKVYPVVLGLSLLGALPMLMGRDER
jgi:hypothetical protein